MSLSIGFRRVADIIDTIEAADATVVDASVPQSSDGDGDGRLHVDVSIAVPIGATDSEAEETGTDTPHSLQADSSGAARAQNGGGRQTTNGKTTPKFTTVVEQKDESTGSESERVDSAVSNEAIDDDSEGTATVSDDDTDEAVASTDEETTVATDRPATEPVDDTPDEPADTSVDRDESLEDVDHDEPADSDADPDGSGDDATCPDCGATFESVPGMKIHRTKIHLGNGDGSGETSEGQPSYKDPDRLEDVYETTDTFDEMRDALDADVSAQTVRRHAIKHGIHDPDTDRADSTAADEGSDDGGSREDSDAESVDSDAEPAAPQGDASADEAPSASRDDPPAEHELTVEPTSEQTDGTAGGDGDEVRTASDGGTGVERAPGSSADPASQEGTPIEAVVDDEIDAPSQLTLAELKDVVNDADTLYEVQQRFDVTRETATELLERFDLLELVHGRVATRDRREELKAEIDRRVREAVADEAEPANPTAGQD